MLLIVFVTSKNRTLQGKKIGSEEEFATLAVVRLRHIRSHQMIIRAGFARLEW